jgi:hypothetical protein
LQLVSAWATRNRLALEQYATGAEFNEFAAKPDLFVVLMRKGCIVTIDAVIGLRGR